MIAEMRNFSAAECGKAIRGTLRNVPHLIFRKLPLDNFPHSAICIPQNTRAHRTDLIPSHPPVIATLYKKICAICSCTSNAKMDKLHKNYCAFCQSQTSRNTAEDDGLDHIMHLPS